MCRCQSTQSSRFDHIQQASEVVYVNYMHLEKDCVSVLESVKCVSINNVCFDQALPHKIDNRRRWTGRLGVE